jgi:hypothetical protein
MEEDRGGGQGLRTVEPREEEEEEEEEENMADLLHVVLHAKRYYD